MTDHVKKFIEENIENIEHNKWFLLFNNWYDDPRKEFPDTNQFEEFLHILRTIDKNINKNKRRN